MGKFTAIPTGSLIGLGFGALIEFPALLLAFVSAGFGHGDYVVTRLLFPVPMLCALWEGQVGAVALLLALAQFPIYGLLLGRANTQGKFGLIKSLAGLHVVAAVICLSGFFSEFS